MDYRSKLEAHIKLLEGNIDLCNLEVGKDLLYRTHNTNHKRKMSVNLNFPLRK